MMSDDVKVRKGMELLVMAQTSAVHASAVCWAGKGAIRVFCVLATRAKQRLEIGVGGDGGAV